MLPASINSTTTVKHFSLRIELSSWRFRNRWITNRWITFGVHDPHRYKRYFTPAPSWPDSSTGRALHWHHRSQGFVSHSSPGFFRHFLTSALVELETARIIHTEIVAILQFKYTSSTYSFIMSKTVTADFFSSLSKASITTAFNFHFTFSANRN